MALIKNFSKCNLEKWILYILYGDYFGKKEDIEE